MRTWLILAIALSFAVSATASPRTLVKKGNREALAGQQSDAMTAYKRALDQHGDTSVVLYDIGNVLYQGGDYQKAMQAYLSSLSSKQDSGKQSEAFYNAGNSFFQAQDYDKAIEAYKESLRRNPSDKDAKYNLEVAQRMLKQQQQQQEQQNNQDQQKDDKQEQDKSQQDQQDKQNPDQKDQQQQQQPQDQQKSEEEQTQQQPPPAGKQQMSPEEAERLLNALLQNEQNTLKDARKVKVQTRAKREKDW